MKRKALLISSAILCFAGPVLTGCKNQQPVVSETVCVSNDVSAKCILKTAKETIATIESHSDWVASATELALALDSQGDSQEDSQGGRSEAWAYLEQATLRLDSIVDVKARDAAAADIALALKSMTQNASVLPILNKLQAYGEGTESAGKRVDILCKIVSARAVHESPEKARKLAMSLSQNGDLANAYRGRTQREIAAVFAKQGDFDAALSLLDEITTDFTYYKAIAQTDVMSEAAKSGKKDIVDALQSQAETLANAQDNKYFSAGILRDIGYSYFILGYMELANKYLRKALSAAQKAPKYQEKARATSRIATRLADAGQLSETLTILEDAITLIEQENSKMMVSFSRYEVAGSAAFTNNIELSEKLVSELPDAAFLSATSLKAAGQRDLAWGLVRHGRLEDGITLANTIKVPREKVQALSRIIRLINDPSMDALPRYL